MSGPKQHFYTVWRGRSPGVYASWDEAAAQVTGFKGAQFKRFDTRAEAEAAFRGEYAAHVGQLPLDPSAPADVARVRRLKDVVSASWSVDAACSGNPGRLEYRGVDNRTGQVLFHQGPFEDGTNNIGEFLAIVHALALLMRKGLDVPVYTDSHNAIKWVNEKRCATKLARNERNAPLFDLIARAEAWLRGNEYATRVLKWDTDAWGEIPADFGRK